MQFRLRHTFARLALAASLGLIADLATLTAATRLQLRNGDLITGEIIRRENGRIYFASPLLGQISIPETDAVVIQAPDAPVESLVGLPPSPTDLPPPAPAPPAGSSTTTIASASPSTVPKPPAATTHPWRGKIEFGYQQQSGRRDAIAFSLRADAERLRGPDQFKAIGRTLYGKQDEKTNSDRQDASFRWRHELGNRSFAQSLSSYSADQVKAIDLNLEQNISVGYRLIEHPRHIVNIGLGATGQHREAAGVTEDITLFGEAFQDYTYKISGRISFLQETNVSYSSKPARANLNEDNYRFRFNSALQGRISERVSLNLRYEYEFDNAVPATSQKTDQRVSSSIGYAL